jgi:hypothetical protein
MGTLVQSVIMNLVRFRTTPAWQNVVNIATLIALMVKYELIGIVLRAF